MARKKIQVNITFSGQTYYPTKATLGKGEALQKFFAGENPIVKVWTDSEVFMGTNSESTHLDWVSLKLVSNGAYIFEHSLSDGANYTNAFKTFSKFDSLKFEISNNSIKVYGSITINMSVQAEVYNDTVNSGLLLFQEFGFRLKNNSDIFVFSKYGSEWEDEERDLQNFREGNSKNYTINQPIIESK